MLGAWLDVSGWVNALIQGDIVTPGTADSFIQASHVTKTRHAHQVTAVSLYGMLQEAYTSSETTEEFQDWCVQRAKKCAQFEYWVKTLELEILLLLYIRSLREGRFDMYVESLVKIVPWMFSLDRTNYNRWLPVHIRDMLSLQIKHPSIKKRVFCREVHSS